MCDSKSLLAEIRVTLHCALLVSRCTKKGLVVVTLAFGCKAVGITNTTAKPFKIILACLDLTASCACMIRIEVIHLIRGKVRVKVYQRALCIGEQLGHKQHTKY